MCIFWIKNILICVKFKNKIKFKKNILTWILAGILKIVLDWLYNVWFISLLYKLYYFLKEKEMANPLQNSCLGNPVDRRVLSTTVCEVAKSGTQHGE